MVNILNSEQLTKYKYPYLTVEVFFSIFVPIGPQTKSANKRFPNEEKVKYPVGKWELMSNVKITKPEAHIKIKKTINGILYEPVNHLLNFSQRLGEGLDWTIW